MNKNSKKYIIFALALALVVVSGKFTADHFLKAADGEDIIVDAEEYEEYTEEIPEVSEEVIEAVEETEQEVVVEGEMSSEAVMISEETADVTVDEKPVIAETETVEVVAGEAVSEELLTEEEILPEDTKLLDVSENDIAVVAAPKRNVIVSCNVSEDGTKVLFTSSLEGFEDAEIAYQWQADDGNGWMNIDGADSDIYEVELNEENASKMYRLNVNVL